MEEGPRTGGWGAEILASVVEHRVGSLQMAWRLTMPDVPLPYSPPLEDAFLPSAERIAASVIQRLGAELSRALAQT